MRVLLHACCGPCMLEPLDALAADHEVTVVFVNPNIQPSEEHERRRDTLLAYASAAGIEVVELPYQPHLWHAAVSGEEGYPEARCRLCMELRLGLAAEVAAEMGCDALATTLTVSPYQDWDTVAACGTAACERAGVAFMATDFRDLYPGSVRRSRELGMYRQSYCGCLPSLAEAEEARRERRVRPTPSDR